MKPTNRFGPDLHAFFEAVYRESAPWDIGVPQPDMVRLLDEHPPRAPVLDVGCGAGDLALHLAAGGLETTGIDFVEEVIAQAQAKRDASPAAVAARLEFRVADALHPSRLRRAFGSVVDSGFYHVFDEEVCDRYVDELAAVLQPGGRCYLHEFAVELPDPNMPRQVTEEELRRRFAPERGWRILSIRAGEFLSRMGPAPAILACVERLGGSGT